MQLALKVEQLLVVDDGLVSVAKLQEETGYADQCLGLIGGVVRTQGCLQALLPITKQLALPLEYTVTFTPYGTTSTLIIL